MQPIEVVSDFLEPKQRIQELIVRDKPASPFDEAAVVGRGQVDGVDLKRLVEILDRCFAVTQLPTRNATVVQVIPKEIRPLIPWQAHPGCQVTCGLIEFLQYFAHGWSTSRIFS